MKKIFTILALVVLSIAAISCSQGPKKPANAVQSDTAGWLEYKNKDFTFEYPADWYAAENGGEIDHFGSKGVVAVNSFGEADYWFKPINRPDLFLGGGGVLVNELPENGVYLFIMDNGDTGEKRAEATSELKAPTKPVGDPQIFKNDSFKILGALNDFPKDKRKDIERKWTVKNDWLHYRVEIKNHAKLYDAHIYVLGDAVKKDKKVVEQIVKSFKLVKPTS